MKNPKNNSHGKSQGKPQGNSKPPFKGKAQAGKKNAPNQRDKARHNPQKHNKSANKSQNTPRIKTDLYGAHAVSAAWLNPDRHIHDLYITDRALEGFDDALTKAHDMGLKRPSPQIVDKGFIDNITPQGSVHQGIALHCRALEEIDIHDIIRREDVKDRSVLLMLDQVTDPHNVGAIIRSACAFGAAGMIMQRKHAPELTGVLAKTACGGVEHLPVAYETNLTRTIEALQEAGYFVIGLAEEGEEQLQTLSVKYQKLVLVLGAEGDGLRRLVRERCNSLVALPTAGPISSLNVSNAAAVTLFAANLNQD